METDLVSFTECRWVTTVNVPPGALAEWLADHPVMLSSVLPLVLQALGNPDLSVSSVSTLKKICRECKYDLPPYATNIVAVSQVRVQLLKVLFLKFNNQDLTDFLMFCFPEIMFTL